ncbi:MAG: cytosine permease [Oleibacter sp.]|nr:cytosine permease [Thalassolituus sp.]
METTDYPLSEVPKDDRKGLVSTSILLLGFTFFTATMFAGGTIGTAFSFGELLMVITLGNLLLGLYAAALAYIACKSGLNSILMGRFCFGEVGSKLSDLLLGFTQVGWYAWGAATIGIVLVKTLSLPAWAETPLIIGFGLGFCITAMIGYRGMEILSRFAVPVMMLFIVLSMYTGISDIGGLTNLMSQEPTSSLSVASAVTIIIGTFVSGGTQATNWSRFAKSPKVAVISTMVAFFFGNGLMVLTGAFGALIYQQADVVDVLLAQGFVTIAVLMLMLNLWTTQDNTIYNVAVAGCNLFRTEKRRTVTIVGGVIGTILAVGGMYNFLIPFLVLLGTFIPPIGGVIMADFWIKHKGEYPKLAEQTLPAFNWVGLTAYAIGSAAAFVSPTLPPVVGVLAAALSYAIIFRLPMGVTNLSKAES